MAAYRRFLNLRPPWLCLKGRRGGLDEIAGTTHRQLRRIRVPCGDRNCWWRDSLQSNTKTLRNGVVEVQPSWYPRIWFPVWRSTSLSDREFLLRPDPAAL